MEVKITLFDRWVELGIYDIIGKSLLEIDKKAEFDDQTGTSLKIYLIEILNFLTQIKINPLISYLKSSDINNPLLAGLLNGFIYGDQGLQMQINDFLKYVLDIIHERKNEIGDYFYENFFPRLIEHFNKMELNEVFYSFIQQMTELLIYCVKCHGYRIRHFIIHQKLLNILYKGFKINEKSVSLSILRLIKAIIISKDEFLIKHIINNNLLSDIFELYLKNANKTNLVNSACLELFEIIRKENIKKLINHLVENFKEKILQFGLAKFFEKLFIKYEQLQPLSLEEQELKDFTKSSYSDDNEWY